jgi:hypothetical protein
LATFTTTSCTADGLAVVQPALRTPQSAYQLAWPMPEFIDPVTDNE